MISYDLQQFGAPLVRNERPTPAPQGSEVLVRVLASGVCHSDIHIRHGYYDMGNGKRLNMGERGAMLPLTMGHETAGEIVAAGPEAGNVQIGQRVVVYPWLGCGQCKVCARGQENLCLTGRSLGVFARAATATTSSCRMRATSSTSANSRPSRPRPARARA